MSLRICDDSEVVFKAAADYKHFLYPFNGHKELVPQGSSGKAGEGGVVSPLLRARIHLSRAGMDLWRRNGETGQPSRIGASPGEDGHVSLDDVLRSTCGAGTHRFGKAQTLGAARKRDARSPSRTRRPPKASRETARLLQRLPQTARAPQALAASSWAAPQKRIG